MKNDALVSSLMALHLSVCVCVCVRGRDDVLKLINNRGHMADLEVDKNVSNRF